MTPQEQPDNRSVVWLLAIVAVLCVFPVFSMALSQYFDTRESAESRCSIDDHHPDAAVHETALIEARITAFPAGRLCVWEGAEGGQFSDIR